MAADSEYRALYGEVVRIYASLAANSPKKLGKSTTAVAYHDATRLRKAGVTATKSVFVPTELDRPWNSEYDNSFAAILSNLRQDLRPDEGPDEYLRHLIKLSEEHEENESQSPAALRRQSTATVRTFAGLPDEQEPDPRAAEGTAQDADRIEEEEVGTLALDCLKAIFQSQNRAQVRGGAIAYLRYLADEEQLYIASGKLTSMEKWAAKLFLRITSWTPVQDRFILLVVAVEALARYPLEKAQHFRVASMYAKVILGVLRSDLNAAGLSVIDILLGLIHQTVKAAAFLGRLSSSSLQQPASSSSLREAAEDLIPLLKDCIANLARHVYYSDQVTDLISFILLRVKASPASNPVIPQPSSDQERAAGSGIADSETDPKASANDVASSSGRAPTEGRTASVRSGIFATEYSRQIALEVVRDIICVAQSTQQYSAGSVNINRNRVPLGVWEGSQWLLRDPSEGVRKAYKEALLEWAQNEAEEGDAALIDFEADDCIEKLAEKNKPASIHGSIGQSHRSAHPQLLMLPNFGTERRMSSGKNSSNGTEGALKPRVRASDLQDVVEGRRQVPIKMGSAEPVDVKQLLAAIKIDPSRNGLKMAPPYH